MFFYKPIVKAASLIVTYKYGEFSCRCFILLVLISLYASSSYAQGYCPDGVTPKSPTTKCPPVPKQTGRNKTSQASTSATCSIKVRVEGVPQDALGKTTITLQSHHSCEPDKRNKKNKPYLYSQPQSKTLSDGKNEVEFTGLRCSKCNHSLTVQHPQFTFKNNPQLVINPSSNEVKIFEAIPPKPPKPAPQPCNGDVPPIPISFDPQSKAITPQSACIKPIYFNEHRFEPKDLGYFVTVTLASENLGAIDFQVLQDGVAMDGADAGSTPQSLLRSYEFQAKREYILRLATKNADAVLPLGYTLTIRRYKWTAAGYKERMDQVESLLGTVKAPASTLSLFNSLNRQIEMLNGEDANGNSVNSKLDSSNLENIRKATEILRSLTDIESDVSNTDQAVVHSALGIIYRYCLPDAELAKKHDLRAIQLGGAARFRIRFSESRESSSRYRHWFLVKSRQIALERLIVNPQIDKFMSLNAKDLNPLKGLKAVPEKKPASSDWILELRAPGKTYFVAPMSKDNKETTWIKELIERN